MIVTFCMVEPPVIGADTAYPTVRWGGPSHYDAADARAIWLAVQQPGKPVAVKTEAQQAVLALHRMRQQLVKFRIMQTISLRGLLTEYGEVMGKSARL